MPSDKLNEIQQELHNYLKENGYKIFDIEQYQNPSSNASKCLSLYQNYLSPKGSKLKAMHDFYTELETLDKRKDRKKTSIYDNCYKHTVEIIFGISHKPTLAEKIMDPYYEQNIDITDIGEVYIKDELKNKLDSLISYCKKIDICYDQYRQDKEEWTKNEKARRDYINFWKSRLEDPILGNADLLQFYIEFLTEKHPLNGKLTLKINFLLKQKLPNIDTDKIAKEIIEFSNIFKK